ncbi:aldo-keto reductase family 1 member B1-like isoform X1 [Haliotis rubra]|uniref:aldo-keto reductase family 1 member B1-like isoform X1 n=1 Tax=Haliotis rubra TaxID=36100 RepID=UPI001EE55A42|nr:aldo-keto reductase family 1 member B1-like isoform X1 [Haliotis rubra]
MAAVPNIQLNTGYPFPVLGFGTFANRKEGVMLPAVKAAISSGYRHIDTAWYYTTEPEVGGAIKEKLADGTVTRDELFVTSKLWNTFHEPFKVGRMCRDSLRDLQLDYLDLYLMHWPMGHEDNESSRGHFTQATFVPNDVDYLETWQAMEDLIDGGLVRSIGVANFNLGQLKRLLNIPNIRYKPAVLQIEMTPYLTNVELLEFCNSHGIAVTGYSPLGGPNMIYAPPNAPNLMENPTIVETAKKFDKTPAQVLLRWGIQRGYAVIPSSVIPQYITENIEIFDFALSDEDMKKITSLNRNYRFNPTSQFKDHPHYPFK